MNTRVHAETLFKTLETPLELAWMAGREGASRVVWQQPVAPLGTALCGTLDWIRPRPVQLVGPEELAFLESLEATAREPLLKHLCHTSPGVLLLCAVDSDRCRWLSGAAEAADLPLWHTRTEADRARQTLEDYQRGLESAATLVHGVFLEVYGLGVLLSGSSGTGKSEVALELLSRGHRLIADDSPLLTRVAPEVIEGTCPRMLYNFLEVRGLGILNIRRMFGDSAVKRNKRVRLIIHLVRQEEAILPAETRLAGARSHRRLLEVDIPEIMLPIAPGRNLAVLVECAVRDHILRLSGYNADEDL
ncbi:MAG: HPr(Ser) kinase/phosphatase, partial [Candidatus Competibacteraceae bacterium]|nr:HPr(Ser) kinase/phosphatase [Candidatus Competibacteraceae bacterium]